MTPLTAAIRVRDAALRDLARADRVDKGSRWITHPAEMRALSRRVAEADAEVERLSIDLPNSGPCGYPEDVRDPPTREETS